MAKRKKNANPFAENLQLLLREHNMGVRAAAKIAGVSPGTISNWTAGTVPDDFISVQKLAVALGTTLSFLLTGADDSRPEGPPSIAEVFSDGGSLFDGNEKITIQRLIPKKSDEDT